MKWKMQSRCMDNSGSWFLLIQNNKYAHKFITAKKKRILATSAIIYLKVVAPSLEFKLYYIDKCEKHLNCSSRTDSEVVLISSITEAKLLHREQIKDQRLLVQAVVFFSASHIQIVGICFICLFLTSSCSFYQGSSLTWNELHTRWRTLTSDVRICSDGDATCRRITFDVRHCETGAEKPRGWSTSEVVKIS